MPVPIPTAVLSSCDQGLDDIEDIVHADDLTPEDRINNRRHVTTHTRRTNGTHLPDDEAPIADSIIPGTQTIFIKTWGCTHNNSDSEYMAGQLAAFGYRITTSELFSLLF